MVTREPMVCWNSSKGLVMQEKDTSPLLHPTKGKLHCYLIISLGRFFYPLVLSKVQGRSPLMRKSLPYQIKS